MRPTSRALAPRRRAAWTRALYLAANGDPALSSERPAWDLRAQHAGARHVPRALSASVISFTSRRARSTTGWSGTGVRQRTPVAPRLPYAISKLASEHYVRVFRRTPAHRRQLRQRAFLRRLRAVRARAEDHDALDARHDARPARVHASRQRRKPHRLHVRRRCGGWVPGADTSAGFSGTVDFASGAPVSVNAVAQTMAPRARRRGHGARTRDTPRSTSSFISVDRTMRDRFGFEPAVVVRDGVRRLHAVSARGARSAPASPRELSRARAPRVCRRSRRPRLAGHRRRRLLLRDVPRRGAGACRRTARARHPRSRLRRGDDVRRHAHCSRCRWTCR